MPTYKFKPSPSDIKWDQIGLVPGRILIAIYGLLALQLPIVPVPFDSAGFVVLIIWSFLGLLAGIYCEIRVGEARKKISDYIALLDVLDELEDAGWSD